MTHVSCLAARVGRTAGNFLPYTSLTCNVRTANQGQKVHSHWLLWGFHYPPLHDTWFRYMIEWQQDRIKRSRSVVEALLLLHGPGPGVYAYPYRAFTERKDNDKAPNQYST